MNNREAIMLMDPFGTVEQVVNALGSDAVHFDVVKTDQIPLGAKAFAVMLGPETPFSIEDVQSLIGLKVVAVTSTGYDHVPVDAVVAAGACVTTSAGYCTEEVAEHALALVLCGLRRLPALDYSVRSGEWDVTQIAPKRIEGSSVGLLGFGRIAQSLARRLIGLGVRVKAYDPMITDEPFRLLGVQRVDSAGGAMKDSDVISMHVPLTSETEYLLDDNGITALRSGTFVVNVARGGLIDPNALLNALRSGQISGAGLDVFEAEPLPDSDPLRSAPNVLLGPHGAWYSEGAKDRLFTMAATAIRDVFHGRPPSGLVAQPNQRHGSQSLSASENRDSCH